MRKLLTSIFGTSNDRYLKSIQPLVDQINGLEDSIQKKSDEELRALTAEYKKRFQAGESLDDLLPEAFATVREAAKRTLGERHYDVQLIGGIVLHQGKLAEMKTGEGKTLVATLAAYLNALAGKGVHVVTVNDYLARRDGSWMAQVYNFLGLSCGFVIGGLDQEERKAAYNADITYVTNNELSFDYLRDNMKFSTNDLVMRSENPMHFAIVDEVDSILIDEARTPIIISGPAEDKTELYVTMAKIVPQLDAQTEYKLDEKGNNVTLTEAGMDKAEELFIQEGLMKEGDSLYDMEHVQLVHHLNKALHAHTLIKKDREYIIRNNQIMLVDPFTGRTMEGRSYGDGLHQAIQAREGLEIQPENQTLASVTYQNYFRMYSKLAGMTGTADTEAEEFESIYGLKVVVIPTHRPIARLDEQDIIYRTKEEKFRAIVRDVKEHAAKGMPVLVGTASIEASERFSEAFKKEGIEHKVLNARYHEQEADIIAQAGRKGAVTIATNMAGRGTDIKLGGNLALMLKEAKTEAEKEAVTKAYEEEKREVMEAGGLRIIGTERHESRRIDNQLRGRAGRQGDVGSTAFYISLQDDLMRIFASGLDNMMQRLNMPEDEAIQSRLITNAIETAQRRIESQHFENRKNILKFDDVLNDQRLIIYEQRQEMISSETVDDVIVDFVEDEVTELVHTVMPQGSDPEQWQLSEYKEKMKFVFNVTPDIDTWALEDDADAEVITERTLEYVKQVYAERERRFTPEVMRQLEQSVLVQTLDELWKEHLQRLDYLRQAVAFRGHAQKNPLNEYKIEAFGLFESLLNDLRSNSLRLLFHVQMAQQAQEQIDEFESPIVDAEKASEKASEEEFDFLNTPRNAPCPCGSGKKFKHCHGAVSQNKESA